MPPAGRPGRFPDGAVELLSRLTVLSQELASAYRPTTVVEIVARALTDVLAPAQLTIVLLDPDANHLTVVYELGGGPTRTDDPLLQLALARGPLVLPADVAAQALARGAATGGDAPASWIGAPLRAVGRTIGAVSLASHTADDFGPAELAFVNSVVAKAAIALENSRLLELLSSGKREWELTVDAIPQAICIVSAHGVARRGNRIFAELVGLPVTALPGRPWLTLVPPPWSEAVGRVLAGPGGPPVELRSGDRIFLISAVPMAGAETGAAVLIFDDQTDKRRLQAQLVQSEKMSAIGQLIAGVAHDLNNPLASVVGFSDFLSEAGEIPPALAEPLAVIRQEAERAATIVRNLLSFARRQEGERGRQALGPLVESVLALMRNELMALRVDAALQVETDAPDVEVNANQIKQVFVNLLTNAAQAIAGTRRPGRVWITVKKWLDGVAVTVADDGPGMSEELAQRAFEPFFTTKPEGEGTGLGLSICQGILREHGGRITLDSSPGAGATFTVELPAAGHGARPSAGLPTPAAVQPLRVLVVDDEPHIRYYMRATLESWGHTVHVAGDGEDAYALVLAQPFDVVICDLRMPRLGGREMYQRLVRERPASAERVIFSTGDTVRGDTLHFLESLGRPYLRKPFTLAELRHVLAGVVKQLA
jgi:two-component system NtrC family sensor kinase